MKNKEILVRRWKLVKIVNSISEQRKSNMNIGNFNNLLFNENENSNDKLNNNNINVNINDDTNINEKKSWEKKKKILLQY